MGKTVKIVEDFVSIPNKPGYELNSQGLARRNDEYNWSDTWQGTYLLPKTIKKNGLLYAAYRLNRKSARHIWPMLKKLHGTEPLSNEELRRIALQENERIKRERIEKRCTFVCERCGDEFRLSLSQVYKIEHKIAPKTSGRLCGKCHTEHANERQRQRASTRTSRRCRRCRKRLPVGYWMYCPDCHKHVSQFAGMF